jgi:predicted DsbA family dithiol-disulfide isomerase
MATGPKHIKLTIISDFTCPWCYIGYKEINAAIQKCSTEDLPVTFDVEYRPFLINPSLTDDAFVSREEFLKRKLGEEKAVAVTKMMADRAKELGFTMNMAQHVRSTRRAHRLMLRAWTQGGQDLQQPLFSQISKAYYEQATDIGDIDVLASIAADCKIMSKQEAVTFMKSDELLAEVEKTVASSRANGVSGVPFTVIDGKWAISGGQSSDVYYQIFSKLAKVPPVDSGRVD